MVRNGSFVSKTSEELGHKNQFCFGANTALGRSIMKKLFLPLFLLATTILVNSIHAETLQHYGYRGQHGIVLALRGSWDVGVGSVEGGFGYKHWISKRWTIKSFLTFGKTDTTIAYGDNGYPVELRIREKSYSLLTGVEDHFWKKGRLSFFYGGGILFKFSSSKINYTLEYPPEIENRSKRNIFGIQSTLGVEYFLTKRLSLSGQYQIDFSLGKESRKSNWWGNPDANMTTWNLGTSTSALILTIYL
jgi:hypothetical protein